MEITNTTDVISSANGTTNSTLFGDRNLAMQNLSQIPAADTVAIHPGLSYSIVIIASLLLFVGVFGNGMTLVVTLKSENRFKPHNILIMSLAVADTLSLLMNTFNIEAFGELSIIDMKALISTNDFTCSLFRATIRTSLFLSTLMIMLICIERFIAVWCPLKARHFLTTRLAVSSVATCVGATLAIVAIPSVVYGGNRNGVCYDDFDVNGDGKSDTIKSTPLLMVMAVLFIVTPMVIILTLTPMTIFKLYRHRLNRRDLTTEDENTGPDRTSVLLTAVVVVYLTLSGIPYLVHATISASGTNLSATTGSLRVIAKMCFAVIVQANFSTNFILYTWLSAEFRQKIFSMLGCSRCLSIQSR